MASRTRSIVLSQMSRTLPKIKAIITDWDDTITDQDTIGLVAEAAYITKPDFPFKWDHFSNVYYSNYAQFIEDFGPRETLEDEIRYQKSLKKIELSSVNEYVGLQLFKNVTHETLIQQANKVKLKPHFFEFLKKVDDQDIPVVVLSCNWTSLIMSKVFEDNGFKNSKNIQFITNEFEDEDGVLTGEVSKLNCIRTGTDKVKQVKAILDNFNNLGITDGVYYFGDSATDILPILEVDYGVILGDGSALKTLKSLDIPYDEGLQGSSKIKRIESWKQVLELVE